MISSFLMVRIIVFQLFFNNFEYKLKHMKRSLPVLLCIISFSTFAQYTTVQVLLKPGYFFYETSGIANCTECSNDVGLNQIINSYVSLFQYSYSMDQNSSNYDYTLGLISVMGSQNALALVNDLNAYSAIVYNASIEQFSHKYNYYLYIRLSSLSNGNYVSTDSNGIIVTSNAQLNLIFQQFNVKFFELGFPSTPNFNDVFAIGCQFCDTANLKTALESLEGTVLVTTENIIYTVLLNLNTDSYEKDKRVTLYPNPTTGIFEVQIDGQFQDLDVELFDSNGRVIYEGKMNSIQNSSQSIDISSLSKGVYFVRVKNEELTSTKKIIKN